MKAELSIGKKLTCEVCAKDSNKIVKFEMDNGYPSWICFDCLCLGAKIANIELTESNEWHLRRWEVLQKYQQELPEPYRTDICDILANGFPRSWIAKKRNCDGTKLPTKGSKKS